MIAHVTAEVSVREGLGDSTDMQAGDGVKTLLFGMRDLYNFHMSLCEEAGVGTTGGASEFRATRDRKQKDSWGHKVCH